MAPRRGRAGHRGGARGRQRPGVGLRRAPPGQLLGPQDGARDRGAPRRCRARHGPGAAFAPDIAADGIDEWLGSLSGPAPGDQRLDDALPEGAVLHVHGTDDGLDEAGEWLVRREGSGLVVEHGHGKGDVAVRGPAARLLLVLLRRVPPDDPQVQVMGDAALLTGWLASTPF